MDKSRPAADRVRPFLAAMERSIDAARRQRLQAPGERPTEAAILRIAEPATTDPVVAPPPPRLKARPNRSNPFQCCAEKMIRSQAG